MLGYPLQPRIATAGKEFVTRKITDAVARIRCGLLHELRLGNLSACRDWGYSKDYVRAMWLMLQAPQPDDYVVATGEQHSVQEVAELAFARVGLEWREHVREDSSLLRPAEVDHLIGDATKVRTQLGWRPTVGFQELINLMVDADMELVQRELQAAASHG